MAWVYCFDEVSCCHCKLIVYIDTSYRYSMIDSPGTEISELSTAEEHRSQVCMQNQDIDGPFLTIGETFSMDSELKLHKRHD